MRGGGGLVKVGGVDTEMYRTGHPHACSITLATFCCRSCCWTHREDWSYYVQSGTDSFSLSSDHRASFSSGKEKTGMLSLSFSARSVSTE